MPLNDPIPSTAADVLEFNVEKIDEEVTSTAATYTDRFGVERLTNVGRTNLTQDAIAAAVAQTGFFPVSGSFEAGGTIDSYNQVLNLQTAVGDDAAGFYSWGGALPKVVAAGSTPSTTGGTGATAWSYRADAKLRTDLSAAGGAKLITDGVIMKDTVAAMVADTGLVVGDTIHTRGRYAASDMAGHKYRITDSTGGDPVDGLKYVALDNGLFAKTNDLVFNVKAPADSGFAPNENKWFFMDPQEYNAANTGEVESVGNQFHFFHSGADVRVEFEADNSPMQFYLEGGPGFDAWYGVQEGGTHHWSHGSDVSDGASYKFCTGFGISTVTQQFIIRKDGTVSVKNDGSGFTAPYGFIGDANTGMFSPAIQNIGFKANGNETMRIGSTGKVFSSQEDDANTPSWSFLNDQDTGVGHAASDNLTLITGGTERLRVGSTGTFYFGGAGFGAGTGTLAIKNAAAAPTTNHPNGGILYVEGGALKFRGSAGTVTTIAPA